MSVRSRPATLGGAAWLGRWWSLLVVLAALAAVTVTEPYANGPPIRSDGVGYHLWTRALLDGDLSFRAYKDQEAIYPAPRGGGLYVNKYPPGVALFRLPVMAPLVDRRPGAPLISPAEHLANQLCGAAALVAVCWLCLRTCRLLAVPPADAHLALLTTTFGTGLFHYATYDASFSHVYSALAAAFLVWLGARAVVAGHERLPGPATAAACFFLVLFRNTNVLLLAALATVYLDGRRRRGMLRRRDACRDLAAVLVGACAAAAVQLAYNYHGSGRLTLNSYVEERFLWDRPMQAAVVWSFERGLFTYYPVLAVVLAAAWLGRQTRPAAAVSTLLVLAYVALYGFWWSWHLGMGFGHRGFVELAPAAAVLLAAALGEAPGRRRAALSACAVVCALVTLELMAGYWRGSLPMWHASGRDYGQHVWGAQSFLGPLLG
jgi:hypothetical protein